MWFLYIIPDSFSCLRNPTPSMTITRSTTAFLFIFSVASYILSSWEPSLFSYSFPEHDLLLLLEYHPTISLGISPPDFSSSKSLTKIALVLHCHPFSPSLSSFPFPTPLFSSPFPYLFPLLPFPSLLFSSFSPHYLISPSLYHLPLTSPLTSLLLSLLALFPSPPFSPLFPCSGQQHLFVYYFLWTFHYPLGSDDGCPHRRRREEI